MRLYTFDGGTDNLKYFLITLLTAVSCCAISTNAEEAENIEIPEESQVTEASEESTEPEITTGTIVTTDTVETTVSTEITEVTTTAPVSLNIKYRAINGHIEIIGCDSRATSIVIPAEIDNLPVTAISSTAFYNNSRLKSIEFPEGITEIDDDTFYNCTGLETVKFSNGLTSIGQYAFYNCTGLVNIELPESLRTIDDFAFGCCKNLSSVKIYNGLKNINVGAFYECKSLESIELPESVSGIGRSALAECTGLKKITILNSSCSLEENSVSGNAAICSYNGSTAQTYAKKYKIQFEQIIVNQEEDVPGRVLGDANNDGKMNIADAAFIARKVAQRRTYELSVQYGDYNNDGTVNILDAASIARYIAKRLGNGDNAKRNNVILNYLCPNKSDYNFNNIAGMKNYVNDYVRYYAHKEYGITAVAYDDKVDVWEYSWDVPKHFIPNTDYYMEQNNGALNIGSIIYELPEKYKKDNPGWENLFNVVKNTDEAVDRLVESRCTALDMMASEFKAQGYNDDFIKHKGIILCWKSIGGGNYEVYLLWGGNKEHEDEESLKNYWQLSSEVYNLNWSEYEEWYYNMFENYSIQYIKNWRD